MTKHVKSTKSRAFWSLNLSPCNEKISPRTINKGRDKFYNKKLFFFVKIGRCVRPIDI